MFRDKAAYPFCGGMDMSFVQRLTDFMWNPWLLGLVLLTGLYYSVRTGFFQIFGIKTWVKTTVGSLFSGRQNSTSGITRFQALATALASTIGTGSIAGVATAIFFGGPGAVFWMWVCAVLGMMTGCAEKVLAVRWRQPGRDGKWEGGPMHYLAHGMKSPFLAGWFAIACVGGALVGGDLVQSNSIAQALNTTFGWDRLITGVITAALAGIVLVGGIGRIARFSELLVPVMALLFLGSAAVVLWVRREYLGDALGMIVSCALSPRAAAGGVGGYGISAALRYGVARGVFTNEAGMGSSAMAHANADTKHPGEQGMWGILEVFVATPVICTMTALVILTAGVYDPAGALGAIGAEDLSGALVGVPLTAASFAVVLGAAGEGIVSVCLLMFAFSSLLGWSYYGESALGWLLRGRRWRPVWRGVFLIVAVAGSVGELELVWQLVDLFTALMALPNLAALLWLSPQVLQSINEWLEHKSSASE